MPISWFSSLPCLTGAETFRKVSPSPDVLPPRWLTHTWRDQSLTHISLCFPFRGRLVTALALQAPNRWAGFLIQHLYTKAVHFSSFSVESLAPYGPHQSKTLSCQALSGKALFLIIQVEIILLFTRALWTPAAANRVGVQQSQRSALADSSRFSCVTFKLLPQPLCALLTDTFLGMS